MTNYTKKIGKAVIEKIFEAYSGAKIEIDAIEVAQGCKETFASLLESILMIQSIQEELPDFWDVMAAASMKKENSPGIQVLVAFEICECVLSTGMDILKNAVKKELQND